MLEENLETAVNAIEEELDPKKKFSNLEVIKLDLNAVIPLDEFTSEFADPGINIYDNGVLSKFSKQYQTVYDKVKTTVDSMIEENEPTGEEDGDGDENVALSETDTSNLEEDSISIFSIVFSLLLIFN